MTICEQNTKVQEEPQKHGSTEVFRRKTIHIFWGKRVLRLGNGTRVLLYLKRFQIHQITKEIKYGHIRQPRKHKVHQKIKLKNLR